MHYFRIDALPDPQSLPRIVGVFAQRAVVPSAMRMEADSGFLQIEVAVVGLDDARAAVIAAKLGETVAVTKSRWTEGRKPHPSASRASPHNGEFDHGILPWNRHCERSEAISSHRL